MTGLPIRTLANAFFALAFALALGLAGAARADEERIDHYERKPAETLAAAVANFADYNAKLAAVLGKDELSDRDLEAVHEITYTLETALERIRQDLAGLAETLEALHVASESHDTAGTKAHGTAYLATARTVIP